MVLAISALMVLAPGIVLVANSVDATVVMTTTCLDPTGPDGVDCMGMHGDDGTVWAGPHMHGNASVQEIHVVCDEDGCSTHTHHYTTEEAPAVPVNGSDGAHSVGPDLGGADLEIPVPPRSESMPTHDGPLLSDTYALGVRPGAPAAPVRNDAAPAEAGPDVQADAEPGAPAETEPDVQADAEPGAPAETVPDDAAPAATEPDVPPAPFQGAAPADTDPDTPAAAEPDAPAAPVRGAAPAATEPDMLAETAHDAPDSRDTASTGTGPGTPPVGDAAPADTEPGMPAEFPAMVITPLMESALVDGDFAYGPHPRNTFELYLTDGLGRTPVMVYFHQGMPANSSTPYGEWHITTDELLTRGISVVHADYPFTDEMDIRGMADSASLVIDYILDNGLGLGVDPGRMGVYGSGVGGGIALYIGTGGRSGFIDTIGHFNAPSTFDIGSWPSIIDLPLSNLTREVGDRVPALYGVDSFSELALGNAQGLRASLDMLGKMDAGTPPIVAWTDGISDGESLESMMMHPGHARVLLDRCRELGILCVDDSLGGRIFVEQLGAGSHDFVTRSGGRTAG